MTITEAIPYAILLMLTFFGVLVLLPDVFAWVAYLLNDDE